MAYSTLPGMGGYQVTRVSSFDKRAIGKLTDLNHISSLHADKPQAYDRVIKLYTQSQQYANDFSQMLAENEPFTLKGTRDWEWDIYTNYKYPKLVNVPASTLAKAKVGIDGQEFQLIFDGYFSKHTMIKSNRMDGQTFYVVSDPSPVGIAWLTTCTLVTMNPASDFVNKTWLQEGLEYTGETGSIGEFDQELRGLKGMGDKITLYDSIGSEDGFEHTITGWAQDAAMGFSAPSVQGNPLDVIVYIDKRRGETGVTKNNILWEPMIEQQMYLAAQEAKQFKQLWQEGGSAKSEGSKGEVKKISPGVYPKIRKNGNYFPYNRGEFHPSIFRVVFGDLFYRRVDIKDRKVRVFTNEAGFETFNNAMKQDMLGSGLNLTVTDTGNSNRFIQGQGQSLIMNWGFDGMYTRETGLVTLTHLKELDLPETNSEFGRGKKTRPIFFVFDVSPNGSGRLGANVREVVKAGHPPIRSGYIHGTRHHLGPMASVNMTSSSMFDGYKRWMKFQTDVFIEDPSRCVIIEELPSY